MVSGRVLRKFLLEVMNIVKNLRLCGSSKARRNHVMRLNPYGSLFNNQGIIVCGGYSYRRKIWYFLHEKNQAKNGFNSVCEVWDGRAKRFSAIGNRLGKFALFYSCKDNPVQNMKSQKFKWPRKRND